MKRKLWEVITYTQVRKVLGVLCILWAIVAVLTPFTPGSIIALFVGLMLIYGKEEAREKIKKWIGETRYHRWKLDRFFEEKK